MTNPSDPEFDYQKLDRLNRIITAMKLTPVSISPDYESPIEPIWEYRCKSPIHSIKDDAPHAQLTVTNELDSDNVVAVLKQGDIKLRQLEELDEDGKPFYYRVRTDVEEVEKLTVECADYLLAIVSMINDAKGNKSLSLAIAETIGARSCYVNNLKLDVP